MEDFLKPLETIRQVEVPISLSSRIQQRIQYENENRVSLTYALSIAASFLIILSFNILAVTSSQTTSPQDITLVEVISLTPDNHLYK
ncbi:MAG: hypothetical protein WAT79_05690 [Saprospiraceae bacterium]